MMSIRRSTSRARQHGFTLIELMVASTIGLFLLGMIGGVYLLAKQTFRNSSAEAGMDQNARAVLNLIGISVRQAGFNGCASIVGTYRGDTRNINAAQAVKWWNNLTVPIQAALGGGSDFPTAVAGTDVLMLVGVDPANEVAVISDNPGTSIINTGASNFSVGQTLMASSCQLNSFFVVDSISGGAIGHGGGGNCNAALNINCAGGVASSGAVPTAYALQPGTPIMPVVAGAYYVAPSATSGKGNSLWYASTSTSGTPVGVEIANGVADMQLAFGLDTSGSGAVNAWVSSLGAMPGASAGITAATWEQVRAVRVSLLMVSQPDAGASSAGVNTFTYNGQSYTPGTTSYQAAGAASVGGIANVSPEASLPANRWIYREYAMVFALRNASPSS